MTAVHTVPALRLREARMRMGIDQSELARRMGVHRNTVISIEAGKSEPRFMVVARWARVTHVSLDWIAGGELGNDPHD